MIQIVFISLIFAIIILYLKSINSELTILATIASGIIIISCSLEYLTDIFSFMDQIIKLTKIDKGFYKIIFKITVIAYLVEFGSGIIADFGIHSLADKLQFLGKIVIFAISLPVFYTILNLLIEILQ